MGVSSSARKMLDRKSTFTTTERSKSTIDQRSDPLPGAVKHRFMQMMEVHDRVRARFLKATQPRGSRISVN